jgi:hypothetical protein
LKYCLSVLAPTGLPFAAALGLAWAWISRSHPLSRVESGFALAATLSLPLELWLCSLSGRIWNYYFLPLLPALAVLSCVAARLFLNRAPAPNARFGLTKVSIAMLGVMICSIEPIYELLFPKKPYGTHMDCLVDLMTTSLDRSRPMLTWGGYMEAHCRTGFSHPGRYQTQEPLFMVGAAPPEAVDDLIAAVAKSPASILDVSSYSSYVIQPLDKSLRKLTRKGPLWPGFSKWRPMPGIERFYDFVNQNYTIIATSDEEHWTLYEHNSLLDKTLTSAARANLAPATRSEIAASLRRLARSRYRTGQFTEAFNILKLVSYYAADGS